MKRFHVHIHVEDLNASIAFYERLFSAPATRVEADYAKWMLDDPRINFAISTRGSQPGLDHFGFQTDTAQELQVLKDQANSAEMALIDEGETTCCYAQSEKHWILDPQGIAWEHFHTLGNIPVFHEQAPVMAQDVVSATACCAPRAPQTDKVAASTACCGPATSASPSCAPSSAPSSCC